MSRTDPSGRWGYRPRAAADKPSGTEEKGLRPQPATRPKPPPPTGPGSSSPPPKQQAR